MMSLSKFLPTFVATVKSGVSNLMDIIAEQMSLTRVSSPPYESSCAPAGHSNRQRLCCTVNRNMAGCLCADYDVFFVNCNRRTSCRSSYKDKVSLRRGSSYVASFRIG